MAALFVVWAAVVSPGCKDDDRPPLTTAPSTAAAPVSAAPAQDAETKARKFELASSAQALGAKAKNDGEDAIASACAALEAASKQDCDAVKAAAEKLKRSKEGLKGDARHMYEDAVSRTERAISALCP